jgi:parallel beta-helix repeat protein
MAATALTGLLAVQSAAEVLTITLDAGTYDMTTDEQGRQRILMEDFSSLSQPGEPWLPGRTFHIALPPLAEVRSVTMEPLGSRELPGTYDIAPRPPILPQMRIDQEWMSDIRREWQLRHRQVYDSDAAYPDRPGRLAGTGRLRKYSFVRVTFTPFIYYPRSERLVHHPRARVTIDYTVPGRTDEVRGLLSDRKMEGRAEQLLINYRQAQRWYPRREPEGKTEDWDYVIIATDSMSASCDTLKYWKEDLGYDVKVVTTTWINSNYTGADLPAKIRAFLQDKYLESDWGIEYVLIAGDDDHIPMRRCFPDPANHDATSDTTTPTDYYYAELTSDWDSDGDGFPGEYNDDNIDWAADVYVGRIASNDASQTHEICKKLVEFEAENAAGWKYNALLGGAFSNFANEDGDPNNLRTDGAELMEDMITDMLGGLWSTTTMYEKAGRDTSNYLCDTPLTHDNFTSDWNTGTYGIVNWWAHGGRTGASRKWWSTDDGDGVPEAGEMSWQRFIENDDAPSLDDDHPSIVFANSCWCGQPDGAGECLGQKLLKQGSSGMVASTRVSWYWTGWDDESDGGNASIDYNFFDELLNRDKKVGEALFDAKVTHGSQHVTIWHEQMNMFDFNLYGDPSMIWQGAVPGAASDTISADTTWTVSESPYLINNMLYIRGTDGGDNVTTLTINPGVRVVFGEMGGLTIGSSGSSRPGALVADGKADSMIVFTSASDTTKNEPNDWQWIEFRKYTDDNTSLMDHCLIEYPYEGISCIGASPTISNCTIRNVLARGIDLYDNSDPEITNTIIHDCGSPGIHCREGSDPTLYGDSVACCLRGLEVDESSPSVDSCFFVDNDDSGISLDASASIISNSYILDNGNAGIGVADTSSPTISGCQIDNNAVWGVLVGWGSTIDIHESIITHHDSLPAIDINGLLDTAKVYSNILTDNKEALVLDYGWYGSPSQVYYNTIKNNDYGIIVNDTSGHFIHHNDILDNSVRNLHNGTTDTLKAEYNWWGATRSDSIEAGLGGSGEIDYVPFLTNTYHAPWVEVTDPNGGEVVADTTNITWTAPDMDGDTVEIDIFYSDDGGDEFWSLALDEKNDSTYDWDTAPHDDSTHYLIKLYAYDGTYQSWDVSDSLFTVYNPDPPEVTVDGPNGGELLVGSANITWTATDPDLGDSTILLADLEYSPDAGSTWTVIDSNEANDGTYGWDVSELDDGAKYLVRITVSDTSGLSDRDSSDAVFEIDNPDPPTVTVLSPNGGEYWSGTHTIRWTSSDPDSLEGLTYDLYYGTADSGDTTWTQLLGSSSDTSHSWNTGDHSDWGACYVKVEVTDPDTLTDQDLSNTSFTVDNTPPPMPTYLHLDASWDPALGVGSADLSWQNVSDTLSPPEFYQIFHGTTDNTIDYNTPIYSGSSNSCTIDSLGLGPHYFGLKARDSADQPNWVTYQKSKGTNGEAVYFTAASDANLASVAANSNGVVTGSSPNYQLDGSVVLTPGTFMLMNFENLTAGDSDGHHALRVYGRLSAHRSTFSAAGAGDWRGFVFADASIDYDTVTTVGCLVDSCTIRHAVNGIDCHWSSPMINGNEISHCSNAGINCFWSNAIIQNNDAGAGGIHDNSCGIWEDGEGPMGGGILARDNEVRDNDRGMHFGNNAQPSIRRNLIHGNTDGAEFVTGAFPAQFVRNDIYSNTAYGLVNDTTSVLVTAENNWWGAADGPSGQGSGSGDAVSKNVDFSPFLTFPGGTDVVNSCQLISPASISMDVGDTTGTILGQVYEPGVTPDAGQGAGITAQVGYGSNGSHPSGNGWKWSSASYVRDVGSSDEYGGSLTVARNGSYDYAFRFSRDDSATWVYADLDGNDQGGQGTNGYTADQAGDLAVGYVLNPIVVIDDDLGLAQQAYENALINNGLGYDLWDHAGQGTPAASHLNKYQVVIWETGEDLTATITDDDENALMTYLDNGGRLFLSSKGYLTEAGGPRPFITDYLHVDWWDNDVAGIEREHGEPGDVIADGLDLQLEWPLNEGTDDMIPGNGAVGIFQNDHSRSGKQPMHYGGLRSPVAVDEGGSRVVFLCFPFEAIDDLPDPNNQETVMDRVMDWLVTDLLPPEALMAGEKYPAYIPLTWSPPGSAVDTLMIHDGTFEGRIRSGESDVTLAARLTPESYPCVLRTLMFHVWDVAPMNAVDLYVFSDTSTYTEGAPGPPVSGPHEVPTLGHGGGWVFTDIWEEQITIDSGDVYIGVTYRDSLDTGVSCDRTVPFHDRGWWGQSPDGPWDLLSSFGWPYDVSDPSISAVATYSDGSSKVLAGSKTTNLDRFGTGTASDESKALVGYNVYRGQAQGGPYDYVDFVPLDETSYEDHSVDGGERHWYVVTATYHQEESDSSNEAEARSRSVLRPAAVDDLAAFKAAGDIHLTWSAVTVDTAGHPKEVKWYTVYRVNDPEEPIYGGDAIALTQEVSFQDTGVAGDPGVHYYYAVKAEDAAGRRSAESNRAGEFDIPLINE